MSPVLAVSPLGWLASPGFRIALCGTMLAALGAPSAAPGDAAYPVEFKLASAAPGTELSQLAGLTMDQHALILDRGTEAQQRNAGIPFASTLGGSMRPFSAIGPSSAAYGKALKCLTQAVYYEAANQSLAGKQGVAQVVLNRVRHPAYPASVCGVVYEGWNQPVCQFSFVCDGSLRRTPLADEWHQSQAVARAALAGYVDAAVGTATHYHADYVLPRWAYELAKVKQVGTHLFYRFPGKGGQRASFTEQWDGAENIPHIDLARFSGSLDEAAAAPPDETSLPGYRADPTDRRADDDVGGRMDPSKGWKLTIPDPVNASAGYRNSVSEQRAGGEAK